MKQRFTIQPIPTNPLHQTDAGGLGGAGVGCGSGPIGNGCWEAGVAGVDCDGVTVADGGVTVTTLVGPGAGFIMIGLVFTGWP